MKKFIIPITGVVILGLVVIYAVNKTNVWPTSDEIKVRGDSITATFANPVEARVNRPVAINGTIERSYDSRYSSQYTTTISVNIENKAPETVGPDGPIVFSDNITLGLNNPVSITNSDYKCLEMGFGHLVMHFTFNIRYEDYQSHTGKDPIYRTATERMDYPLRVICHHADAEDVGEGEEEDENEDASADKDAGGQEIIIETNMPPPFTEVEPPPRQW